MCRIAMGFVRGFCWAFSDFAHKLNIFGLFCEDSIILWPNFDSNMVSIFVKTQVG